MNRIPKNLYEVPRVRIAPYSLEKCFLAASATVPGATIDDAEEEVWTIS